MLRNLTRILALTFILIFFTNSLAVERAQRYKLELGGDFSFSYDNYEQPVFEAWSVTSLSLTPRFGFFVNRNVQLEPELSLSYISIDFDSGSNLDILNLGFLFRLAYNFIPYEKTFPFVFVGIGMSANSTTGAQDEPTTIVAPEIGLGLKAFIGRSSALRMAIKFVHEENSLATEDLDNNSLRFSAGYSVFLGR